METNTSTLEYKAKVGVNIPQKAKWRWVMASIFCIPTFIFITLGTILLGVANFFLFDTHHFELKITPKK